MYICVHECICACVYICVYDTCASIYVCVHEYVCIYTFVYIYVLCVSMHAHVCTMRLYEPFPSHNLTNFGVSFLGKLENFLAHVKSSFQISWH